jgi:hypothetical protein
LPLGANRSQLSDLVYHQLIADRRAQSTRADHLRPATQRRLPAPHRPAAVSPQATTRAQTPPGLDAFIALDWRGGQLTGIEILDASAILPPDLLESSKDCWPAAGRS